jgi:site-specific DNA recombinase
MKYFIYARKSSEEEDRQILSIDAQLRELKEFALQNELLIVKEFTEAMTAKAPGRPIFNQMLKELKAGKADGIISWNPDRLARNSKDGGEIIYLIDQGVIKDLKFPTYVYDDSPHGKFNLSLAFGFSKLFIDNLSQNVKRGNREKLRRGEYPGVPPRGYINDLRTHTIVTHPEYFSIIKALFERFAIGLITIPEIVKELYSHGIKTRKGKQLSYSTVRDMLANPFYYGVFRYNDELHKGSHEPMITKETHDQIQKQLRLASRVVDWSEKKRTDKGFLFNELGKCGECGYSITREYHQKKNTKHEIRYYRCSKKSKTYKCQQKAINEKNLAPQIEEAISSIAVTDNLYQESMNLISSWKNAEEGNLDKQIINLKNSLEKNKAKLDRLLDICIDGDLDQDDYKAKKNKIIEENVELENKIKRIQEQASLWFEPLASSLKTSNEAYHSILKNDYTQMFGILKNIGLNRILFDQKFKLQLTKPFCFFSEVTSGRSSPETTNLSQGMDSQALSGVKAKQWGSGEAASSLVRRQPLTLSSAHTEGKPRQSHCTAEAVGASSAVFAQAHSQVANGAVGAAGIGVLCEMSLKWHGMLALTTSIFHYHIER